MISPDMQAIVEAIQARQRFVISSHARPDGDSIGSQLAMAYALRALGKEVVVINADPAAPTLMALPGVPEIRISPTVEALDDRGFDAAIIMECGDLARTGVQGLDRSLVINIDHHPGNTGYGQLNWFDETAAACGEMVFDLVAALGVPLTREIATHVYLAILTDTGSFHYSSISPRTFEMCRDTLLAGVDPVQMARMAGGTYDDTEGLINEPLTVKEIQAVVFFKQIENDSYRVSMRSKGSIDIGSVAKEFGGGGHKNAAGCTVTGDIGALQTVFVEKMTRAIDKS